MFEVETLRGQLEEKSRAVLAKNLIETAGSLFPILPILLCSRFASCLGFPAEGYGAGATVTTTASSAGRGTL